MKMSTNILSHTVHFCRAGTELLFLSFNVLLCLVFKNLQAINYAAVCQMLTVGEICTPNDFFAGPWFPNVQCAPYRL